VNTSLKSRLFVFGQFALLALLFGWPADRAGWGALDFLFEFVGVILFFGGAILVFAALRQLFRISVPKLEGNFQQKTLQALRVVMPKPMDDAKLVTTGVFKSMRHPIYTGLILIAYGVGIGNGPVPQLLFAIGLHVVLRYKAELEETFLKEHFDDYAEYMERANRFFPKVED
jgi:protein-S-isoprenylcysteine O-methyltransferase Ste14